MSRRRRNPQHHHTPDDDDPPYPLPDRPPPEYWPPPAPAVDDEQIKKKLDRINQQTRCSHLITHPRDYPIEYPETTEDSDNRIAHIVPITPEAFRDPTLTSQYSWKSVGTHEHLACRLLKDGEEFADTYKTDRICKALITLYDACDADAHLTAGTGIKVCSSLRREHLGAHTFVASEQDLAHDPPRDKNNDQILFERTLGKWTSILSEGCSAPLDDTASRSNAREERTLMSVARYRPVRDKRGARCSGTILMKKRDDSGTHYLW